MKRKLLLINILSLVSAFLFINLNILYASIDKESNHGKEEPVEVATIADLREKAHETNWKYTGNAVITAFYEDIFEYIFIEDETAAILIRTVSAIPETYELYSVLTDLVGEIIHADNRIKFHMDAFPDPVGNSPLVPSVFSLGDIVYDAGNPVNEHQAKLVKFENVSFQGIGADDVFVLNSNYTITDEQKTFSLRAVYLYDDADYNSYIGEKISHDNINIVGVIWQHAHNIRILPRFANDFIDIYNVTFTVKDEYDVPVENAVITFNGVENNPDDYVFENVEARIEPYAYTVEKDGYVTVNGNEVVDGDKNIPVTLNLKRYKVTFTVEDEFGETVENAVITLDGNENDPGDYEFLELLPDTYNYTVEKEGFVTFNGQATIVAEDVTEHVELLFERFTLTFDIVDEDGAPLSGATVSLNEEANNPDDYIFEDLLPGKYGYSVEKHGYIIVEDSVVVETNVTEDVILILKTYNVTFEVRDVDGNDIDDAIITFNDVAYSAGVYVFGGLIPGNYEFTVEKAGYFSVEDDVNVVDEDITVVVELVVDDTSVDLPEKPHFTVFPNPANDKFTLKSNKVIKNVLLINISGQVVKNMAANDVRVEVKVEDLRPGIYFMKVQTGETFKTIRVQITR